MGIEEILPSIHKHKGWKGQYQRMIRWFNKFKNTNPGNFETFDIDEQHDVLYACFQNIFHLKDWLENNANIDKKIINKFINNNLEMRLCRDICNGTKHFELTMASVDNDFTITREFDPFHKVFNSDKYKVIILAGGHKYELKELAWNCIQLWDSFIERNHIT